MNSEIRNAFLNSLVARACYADIRSQSDIDLISSDRYQSKMTDSMAEYFKQNFDFVDKSIDDPSGYDAVLFKSKDNGEFYLGNRGTQADLNESVETYLDLAATDLGDIVADGVAWKQALAMEEFYQSILNKGLCVTMNVSGHSLGGHLTFLFSLLNPEALTHAYTYNGAGIAADFSRWESDPDAARQEILNAIGLGDGSSSLEDEYQLDQSAVQFIENAFSDLLNPDWRNNVSDGSVTNYYVAENMNVVTNAGTTMGQRISVNADEPLDTYGHGMGGLSNALLVAYVMSSIDDSLSMDAINRIVESQSANDQLDRNYAIANLGDLFGFDISQFRNTDSDSAESSLQQVAFNVLGLVEDRADNQDFNAKIIDLTAASSSEIVSTAKQDNANGALMRYALLKLSSFALTNPVGTPPALNEVISGNRLNLSLYNAQTGEGYLTGEWITDRASMLSWLMQTTAASSNSTDANGIIRVGASLDAMRDTWEFVDEESGTHLIAAPDRNKTHLVFFGNDQGGLFKGIAILIGFTVERVMTRCKVMVDQTTLREMKEMTGWKAATGRIFWQALLAMIS